MATIYLRHRKSAISDLAVVLIAAVALVPFFPGIGAAQVCTTTLDIRQVPSFTGRRYIKDAQAKVPMRQSEIPELMRRMNGDSDAAEAFFRGIGKKTVSVVEHVTAVQKGPGTMGVVLTADALKEVTDRIQDPDAKKAVNAMINIAKGAGKIAVSGNADGNTVLIYLVGSLEELGKASGNDFVEIIARGGGAGARLAIKPYDPTTWAKIVDASTWAIATGINTATYGRTFRLPGFSVHMEGVNEVIQRDYLSQPYFSIVRTGATEATASSGTQSAPRTETATFHFVVPGRDKHNPSGPCLPMVDAYLNIRRTFTGKSVRNVTITSMKEHVLLPFRSKLNVRTEQFTGLLPNGGPVTGLLLTFDSHMQFYTYRQTPVHADKVLLTVDGGIYYKTDSGIYRVGSGADVSHATYIKLIMDSLAMTQSQNITAQQDVNANNALRRAKDQISGAYAVSGSSVNLRGTGNVQTLKLTTSRGKVMTAPVLDNRFFSDPNFKNTLEGRAVFKRYQKANHEYYWAYLRTPEGRRYLESLRTASPAQYRKLKTEYCLP